MLNPKRPPLKSRTPALVATIGAVLAAFSTALSAEPTQQSSQGSPAPLILRTQQVALALTPDHDLIAIDLQYEALFGSPLDPLTSDCVSERLGSRWMLPATPDGILDEAIQVRVRDAVEACKQQARERAVSDDPMVMRQIAEAVARTHSANAHARLRLVEAKKQIRGCLDKANEDKALHDCLKSANADLAQPHLLERLLAISKRWIN
jgi:hypothetical protein